MAKSGLQSTLNFILFQMILQLYPKLVYSQYIINLRMFGFLATNMNCENKFFDLLTLILYC